MRLLLILNSFSKSEEEGEDLGRIFTYHIVTYFLHSHHSIVRYGSHKYDTLMLRDSLFLYLTTFRINGNSNVQKVTQDGIRARIFTHPIVTCFSTLTRAL